MVSAISIVFGSLQCLQSACTRDTTQINFLLNSILNHTEQPKYKIINVKHHRRMKRSDQGAEAHVDSIINIRISDEEGESLIMEEAIETRLKC